VSIVGTVEALWRYPVKSMLGEQLTQAPVDARGILGDRLYAVRDTDGKLGGGRNTRRFRRMDGLLAFKASYLPDLTPVITLPDGRTIRGDDEHVHWAIADGIDRPGVTLVKESVISHFDEGPLHLVTTASLRWLATVGPKTDIDVRRVRPNMIIRVTESSGRPEDSWVGRELHVGTHLVVEVTGRAEQPTLAGKELNETTAAFRLIAEENELFFGVSGRVFVPGRVRVGDPVELA
jgi:uncharacterized protein YcbX